MPSITTTLLILTVLIVLLPTETYAFGAGDIPDFSYLNGKAFRHGDIEGILSELSKSAGYAGGGGLLGFASSVLKKAGGGSKFSRSDVKRVYFGNWLRDYSQAMDIAGLSKLTADTIVLVVSVLGFMTFGFATEEFEVTADRLGVYLPVEHIDNPKGYAEKEGDAREFHPKLRPPVEDRELEFDERTGMKKYMATEDEGFDSSTAFIRRTLRECIEKGRSAGGRDGPELYEAYRLLGTGLHTLEDLLAHSNWCEIALVKLGHEEVFCHVGDNVRINTPNGRAPPLVTGTFGGADFLHSLMGEAGDKLSQASVTDLSAKMDSAQNNGDSQVEALSGILKKLPIGGGDETASQGEEMQAKAKAYHFDPDNVAPPDVQKQLLDLLKWRDQVYRDIVAKIEMIPGLADLMDELTNALNAYVFTVLAPYLTPILQQVTGVLDDGSKAVIDSDDQYAVFNDRNASDPSHSMLSKDHFGLILNEPAGKIAQVVVEHTVNLIVKAWSDDSDPNEVLNEVLEAFHHPYYATGQSSVQHRMFEMLQEWLGGLGPDMEAEVINNLSKDSVRNGKNKRVGSETDEIVEYEKHGHGHGHGGGGPAYNTHQEDSTPSYQDQAEEEEPSYNRQESYHRSGGYDESRNEESSHENRYNSHGDGEDSYQSRRHGGGEEEEQHHRYGGGEDESHQSRRYGGGEEENSYSSRRHGGDEEENNYSSRRYGGEGEENSYSSRHRSGEEEERSYSSRRHGGEEESSYSSRRHGGEEESSYGSRRLGGGEDEGGYGSRRYGGGEAEEDHSRRYGGGDESAGYGFQRHRVDEDAGGYQGGGGGHRYGRQEESTYEGSQGYTFGSSGGFGGGGYGGGEEHSGYNPSYERNEDTYGAERLNLGDDNEGYRYGDE